MTRRTVATQQISDLDRQALERAIEIERARNAACRAQINHKLKTEPWIEVAKSAARHCQDVALYLPPWQCWPPCVVEIDDVDEPGYEHRGITQSAALLRRMLAAGLSRYEPDPENALARVEAARVSS